MGRETNDEIDSNEEVEMPIEEEEEELDQEQSMDIQEVENNYYTASFQNIANSHPSS